MRNRSLVFMFAIAGAVACGGPAGNDFTDPAGGSGTGTGGKGGSTATGGKGASTATGGKGGAGGTSGSSSGGKGGTSGTSGSSSGTSSTTGGGSGTGGDTSGSGGTAGDAMGGTSSETGGTAGTAGTGGAEAGGTAGTGGTAGDAMLGGTGGTTDTGGAGGTKAGTGGTTGDPNCDELTQAYAKALEEAKACNSNSGKDQCTEQFPSNLSCGCPVFVNPDNEDAIAELQRLQKEGANCLTVCPAIACVEPGSGVCEPADGTGNERGMCTTSFGVQL